MWEKRGYGKKVEVFLLLLLMMMIPKNPGGWGGGYILVLRDIRQVDNICIVEASDIENMLRRGSNLILALFSAASKSKVKGGRKKVVKRDI